MSASGRPRVWAIVPAAGSGQRFAAGSAAQAPKQYAPLLHRSVLEWTLGALLAEPRVHAIVVVLAAGDAHWPAVADALNSSKLKTASGGVQRQDSVLSGLEYLGEHASPDDWILVHDAARPCLSREDLRSLLDALEADAQCAGAVLAAPIVDTIKRQHEEGGAAQAGAVHTGAAQAGAVPTGAAQARAVHTGAAQAGAALAGETVDRQGLWRALTPQVFKFAQLRAALQAAASSGLTVTDEAQALERLGVRATLVPGSPFNIKVTRAEDLSVAAEILTMKQRSAAAAQRMRVGQGMDVHTFGPGDHVMLAGVRIPYTQGVVAHSDGDVIIHALCDALLGAMGDGDIGQHFPDTDPRYRGADSRVFLRTVAGRMQAARLALVNADVTVLAEAPRVNPHRAAMAAVLAADLGVPPGLINIKATTTEKLGFIGRKEGLAAMATVLLGDVHGGEEVKSNIAACLP
jgi:2-C-methyl-D-erythritol 2,4-cyclodiphosphate synthase/2-C-methyl-D-erythritol 4-phosphate cytidylyltransferase